VVACRRLFDHIFRLIVPRRSCIAIAISLFARLREEFKDPAIPRRHRMLGFIRARYADGRDKLRWQSQVATAPFRQQE